MHMKNNFTDQQIATLCDIAIEADRSTAGSVGLKAEINETIAKGDGSCRIKFFREERDKRCWLIYDYIFLARD